MHGRVQCAGRWVQTCGGGRAAHTLPDPGCIRRSWNAVLTPSSGTAPSRQPCASVKSTGLIGWESSFKCGALDSFYLFAGSHPELARFGVGVALNRAEPASGSFCWANSFLNATTFCSASASVAAVPRTCAMSSFKAVLSIAIPVPQSPTPWRLRRLRKQKK